METMRGKREGRKKEGKFREKGRQEEGWGDRPEEEYGIDQRGDRKKDMELIVLFTKI